MIQEQGVALKWKDIDGQLQKNETQEDMVKCIEEETEFRFLLAHIAKITGTTLAEKLGYLSDAQIAEALIKGDIPIPDDVDDVTALILTKISKVGLELIAGTDERVTVSPADFKRFWRQATERHLLPSVQYTSATTKQQQHLIKFLPF